MSAVLTFTAHSAQPQSYRYQILDQIWREAWGSPLSWELLPAITMTGNYDSLHYGTYRNGMTGDTITCQGHTDGSHTFTFSQGEK